MKKIYLLFALCVFSIVLKAQQPAAHVVKDLKITILSTMLAQEGTGDWGFSALIESDSSKILFDSGGTRHVVLDNAKDLGIDLSKVPIIAFSHGHDDHTSGWLPLRQEMSAINPSAMSLTYVAPGFFDGRITPKGPMFSNRKDSAAYVQSGGKIVELKTWKEIAPGVFLTGNDVPRIYPEKNYPPTLKRVYKNGTIVPDTVPEDMSMVIRTTKGLIPLTGCGHSGTVNLLTAVQKHFQDQPIYAAIGGFHLLASSDEQIKWTAEALKKAGVRYFMGAHCTGIEPVYQIRTWADLKRGECIVGSTGATFDLQNGFVAGMLTMGKGPNAYFKK
ncbi:MBL fold metallo-hydrolase [Mucilaginibacter agri]|uniref:MBL fold metallo-hydrolase n=1 Tax=Mucilaginibacter agri TaxID=2695265 RepID=A0A965ZLT0_9SPHI|nr:MBL fold metallo-hydrolase [Mucilaginibacter agri]NCD72343.1 MBL fold metallo-hydrolase [Mucilaginibacter agri]